MVEPFRISSGEVANKEAVIVRVSDGAHAGWGESSAMAGSFYSAETPDSCQRELIEVVLSALSGRRFDDMLRLEAALAELSPSRFVRVAVETAVWELLARRAGTSTGGLFGITARAVPSGLAVGLYDSAQALCAAIDRYGARDYARLKIKIKRGQDIALVRSVRDHIGDLPLFVDANADYTAADMDVFLQLDRFGLTMFEQPFARHDLETSAALQRRARTPVCLDESIETAADARRAAGMGACGIVNIKLQRVGGYLEALRIVECCVGSGLKLWMGTMPELGIGSAQALALAAHPAFTYATDVEPSARWYTGDLLAPELVLEDRQLAVPPGVGMGFTVDEAQLRRRASAHWTFEG